MYRRSIIRIRGRRGRPALCRGGFSIIELLVVVGLVIVLLSILAIALNVAKRSSQKANTQALMNSIKQALVQFKGDVGYIPPVLDKERNLAWDVSHTTLGGRMNGPDLELPDGQYYSDVQDWYSVTTLAEYMIGPGLVDEDGHDGPGIRNPGSDGYWTASQPRPGISASDPGTLDYRQEFLNPNGFWETQSERFRSGRVLGPYLELDDPRLLGAIDPDEGPGPDGTWRVYFPGEAGYEPPSSGEQRAKVLCDHWGQPLRFYRRPHPPGALNQEYRPGTIGSTGAELRTPTLSDVFVLRPYSIPSGQEVDGAPDLSAIGDSTTTYALQTAEFAILSAGPDRRLNPDQRVDPDEYNADNVVEVGP